jgi:RNA polymerase sigma-70 factor, ECF subfamily
METSVIDDRVDRFELQVAVRGDTAAWERLYTRHYPRLVRIVWLATGSVEIARDAAQETMAKLFEAPPHGEQGTLSGYLSTVAYRFGVRANSKEVKNESIEENRVYSCADNPLDAAIESERQAVAYRAMMMLPVELRAVVVLRFYGNHSYEEIASILGVPLGTVKSRMFRAVKECRTTLAKLGGGEDAF